MPKSIIRISGRSLDNKKAANSGGPLPVWIKRFTNPYAHPILNSSDHPSSFGRAAIRRFFDHPSHRFCAWGHDGDRIGQLPNCAAKWREASLSLAARQGQTWRRPRGICGDPCRRHLRVDLQLPSYSLLFNHTPCTSSLLCTGCCVPACVRSCTCLDGIPACIRGRNCSFESGRGHSRRPIGPCHFRPSRSQQKRVQLPALSLPPLPRPISLPLICKATGTDNGPRSVLFD